LTSSLGSWMDGLAERKAAINVRRSDAIGIERALRMYGTLSVRVRHASNLVGAEPSIEPAVQLLVRGVELVTRGAAGSTRPTWDQQLKFDGQLGRLLERPMLVRVRELVNGEVGRVLGESAVSLTRMLADTSALSASWEALDLCFSGAPDELTGATLSLSATFVPGALHDDVVLRQPGTLRLTVDSGVDLALPYDARELGVLVRLTAGGVRKQTSLITGGTHSLRSDVLQWGERLSFSGSLADFTLRKIQVEVLAALPSAAADNGAQVVGEGSFELVSSLTDLEMLADEVSGVRTTIRLGARGGTLTLAAEWMEGTETPVSDELASLYPQLRPALAMKRLKRDAPIGVVLAHPSGLASFRTFLETANLGDAPAHRFAARNLDCFEALAEHRALCQRASIAAATGAGVGGAAELLGVTPAQLMADSAHAIFNHFLREVAPHRVELSPEVSSALTATILRGQFSAATFGAAEACVLDNLGAREFRRFVTSAHFTDVLRSLAEPSLSFSFGHADDERVGNIGKARAHRANNPHLAGNNALREYEAHKANVLGQSLADGRREDSRRTAELRRALEQAGEEEGVNLHVPTSYGGGASEGGYQSASAAGPRSNVGTSPARRASEPNYRASNVIEWSYGGTSPAPRPPTPPPVSMRSRVGSPQEADARTMPDASGGEASLVTGVQGRAGGGLEVPRPGTQRNATFAGTTTAATAKARFSFSRRPKPTSAGGIPEEGLSGGESPSSRSGSESGLGKPKSAWRFSRG